VGGAALLDAPEHLLGGDAGPVVEGLAADMNRERDDAEVELSLPRRGEVGGRIRHDG
jgi:hypothetical protein